jgi:hypothetical protein
VLLKSAAPPKVGALDVHVGQPSVPRTRLAEREAVRGERTVAAFIMVQRRRYPRIDNEMSAMRSVHDIWILKLR